MAAPVLIDCDPGTDDAIALAMAAGTDALEIGAITTVGGNQTLDKTTRNALDVLSLCGRADLPVTAGMDGPIARDLAIADEVHGESGLANVDLPAADAEATGRHAVDELYDRATAEGALTVLALGPLSNVAIALRRYPDLVSSLGEIVVMGGSVAGGNVTPAAEFNVYTDPEAARIVFDADVPVTMVGLDVTRAARLGPDSIDRIRDLGSEVATVVADLLAHLRVLHDDRYGWSTAPVHDALATAYLADRSVLTTERMHVTVERSGDHTTGATVCDRLDASGQPPNVAVATDVDADRFESLLLDALATYSDTGPDDRPRTS